jgi:phosphate transport system substrate-binding protein
MGALALLATVALAACSSGGASSAPSSTSSAGASPVASAAPGGAALSGSIVIDGSSTVLPISEAAAEDFHKANAGVNVSVKESGTGGGFTKFCNNETDINDASRPIKKDDAKEGAACTANGVTYVQLQVAIDGLTVVVNPANTWAKCMTLAQLKTIYGPAAPEHVTWKQVDPSWPDQEIIRSMPGADSGTFDYFTEVVNGKVDDATKWAQQSEDDNVLVSTVAGNPNAISFFGYAYYVQNQTKVTAVAVDGGKGCIGPTPTTIEDGTYAPLSRPLFIYPNTTKAKASPALYQFVNFYLANAATLATEPTIGYVAVPAAIAAQQLANWNSAVPK